MKTKEEIIADIDRHIETTEECVDNFGIPDYVTELMNGDIFFVKEVKEWIEAEQSAPKWISVKDRLPCNCGKIQSKTWYIAPWQCRFHAPQSAVLT